MDTDVPWIRDKLQLITHFPEEIPKILHLIWVGPKDTPDYVYERLLDWKTLMPHWKILLWLNDDITEEHFPKEAVDKINQSTIPAQKADIMRYFIIKKYGGFYVDTDIIPHKSIDKLSNIGYELVLYHDNELTWEYIINCFFGAIPNHPVLVLACEFVLNETLNTDDVHLKTGPYLLGRAVSVTPTYIRYGLLHSSCFSKTSTSPNKFGTHLYAKSW